MTFTLRSDYFEDGTNGSYETLKEARNAVDGYLGYGIRTIIDEDDYSYLFITSDGEEYEVEIVAVY